LKGLFATGIYIKIVYVLRVKSFQYPSPIPETHTIETDCKILIDRIIQELALNHNMTLFLCGDRQLTRRMIVKCFDFVRRHGRLVDHLVVPILNIEKMSPHDSCSGVWSVIYQVHLLTRTRYQWKENRLQLSLLYDLLHLCQRAQVTDPRDKVYGLLGILPISVSSKIAPDYFESNSEVMVYEKFARAILYGFGRLDVIVPWCAYRKSDTSCPSWVPDLRSESGRSFINRLYKHSASGSSPASIFTHLYQMSEHPIFRGYIVDSVQSLTAPKSEILQYGNQLTIGMVEKDPVKGHEDGGSQIPHRYGDDEQLSAALRRTLTLAHHNTSRFTEGMFQIPWVEWEILEATVQESPEPKQFWHQMESITKNVNWAAFDAFRQTNANFSIFGHKLRHFFAAFPTLSSMEEIEEVKLGNRNVSEMFVAMTSLSGRRLITTRGGYLGLVPEEVEVDDVIAILYGCNFPVVLHPCGDFHSLVGECYVDGMMEGEKIEAGIRGEFDEMNIALC